MKNSSETTTELNRRLPLWLAAPLALAAVWRTMLWLDSRLLPGAGWLLLTVCVLLGGVVWHFRTRAPVACSTRPQLRPLQVSSLASEALGLQMFWLAEPLAQASPLLGWPFWPYVFILGGVIGLGWLSLSATCRDEALLGPTAADE